MSQELWHGFLRGFNLGIELVGRRAIRSKRGVEGALFFRGRCSIDRRRHIRDHSQLMSERTFFDEGKGGHIMCRTNFAWILERLQFEHRGCRKTGHHI